ncbi:kelch-like protein 25 [Styela clava]
MEEKINTDSKEHAVEILQQLNEYRKTGCHCDFMIKAGSEELPVHKNIVSAKKRETLMDVAHMMQLQRLCDSIAILLEDDLDPKSFFQTKKIANRYNCKQLEEKCNQFALQRFREIAKSDEFMDLDKKFISFLMESKETKAKEEVKCKMLLAWTKHDIGERKECFLSLVMKFQLTKMTLSYRKFLVENEPLLFESAKCLRLLTLSVFDSHGDISSKDVNLTENKQLVVFDQTSQRMHSHDIDDKTWKPMQTIDQAIIQNTLYSAVVMESYIYVICENGSFYRLEYAESNAKWEQMTNVSLQYACVVALAGFVYGMEYQSYSNNMERYDPSNNRWTRLTNKSLILYGESLVAADGKVFCIAGYSNQQCRATNQVEIYDPVTSTWSMDNRSLNEVRYCATATATEEGIYVMGGYNINSNTTNSVEFRSSATKTWMILEPMRIARYNFGSCVIDDMVYSIGGNGNPANIEEYDPETKEWKIIETIQGKNINHRTTFCVVSNDSGSIGPDKKKDKQNLNYALKKFCDIFELPLPKLDIVSRKSPGHGSDIADYELDENGKMSLSPSGRFQLQNKLKKFPILPNGDAYLLPICSFENAFSVRFLHKLSSKFNGKYQHKIGELCKKNDILGKVCRILFVQPTNSLH